MRHAPSPRRYAVGAEVRDQGVDFRVWAGDRTSVHVVIDGTDHPLAAEPGGYFSAVVESARAGTRYGFRLDGGEQVLPDPASRFQPDGPHGLSEVIDASTFRWTDADWSGPDEDATVLYEMHVGTFTPEGTWAAAEARLAHLRDVGVTVLEVMPVCDFPGRFGWGYDGVDLWAPTRLYGTPDQFRQFVDAAHRHGVAVVLDVVYNHVGPDGNYLKEFSRNYFTSRYENEWGEPINFDGEHSAAVREFFSSNAAYWIDEFHLDGLRLDATQSIFDSSDEHILRVVSRRVREAARGRTTCLIAENEPQDLRVVTPVDRGGLGLDLVWNDDFHHSVRVALTGHTGAYYTDYRGSAQELVSLSKHGFLYQGQWYSWQKKNRGSSSIGWPRRTFVTYIQNHDQIANYALGDRLQQYADAGSIRAATAFLLLGPGTPMLFQGQEFGSSTPFAYFADHKRDLAEMVAKGRREFVQQFPALATPEMEKLLPRPDDPDVFARCRIDWAERDQNAHVLALHRDLLRIRRDDPPFPPLAAIDGAVLAECAFVLRSLRDGDDDQLFVMNLGGDLVLQPLPEPLLAAPQGHEWTVAWSSESPAYGGAGTPPLIEDGKWHLSARSALLLTLERKTQEAQ